MRARSRPSSTPVPALPPQAALPFARSPARSSLRPPPAPPARPREQERATKVSHGSTARLAMAKGDEHLAKLCGLIAADEGRHEAAYKRTFHAILQRDPSGGMIAFADMMRKQIVMPGEGERRGGDQEGCARVCVWGCWRSLSPARPPTACPPPPPPTHTHSHPPFPPTLQLT